MNGKLTDVLIRDLTWNDPETGVTQPVSMLEVWANTGMLDIIRNIPGVSSAYSASPTEYRVFLDPRYDLAYVKAEIEAQIKIKGEL